MGVVVKSYTSPTLVLLAFDWPEGDQRDDFLGFAIERTPGFNGAASSWLPNRIGFDGPKPDQSDFPSNAAPIQKFYWWDARIDTKDRGHAFTYRVVPVTGQPAALNLVEADAATLEVRVPEVEENGITTHFNRAVVSSQAFAKQFPKIDMGHGTEIPSQQKAARAWLANGMEQAVPQFLDRAAGKDIEGAIYHLTDDIWIIPSLLHYGGAVSIVYHKTSKDEVSQDAIDQLIKAGRPESAFTPRTHANIMHNKFLVRVGPGDHAEAVLAGSANFTSEGLSVQANVLHAFESPALAKLYLDRKRLLDTDPGLAATANDQTGWSDKVQVGDATIRAYFPPAPNGNREAIDTIVEAVKAAKHSVLLCAYDPTDGPLLEAVFNTPAQGKMMFALVNKVPAKAPSGDPNRADVAAKIMILKQSENGDVVGFDAFRASDTPTGFAPERVLWPHEDPKIMVRVHHKFVVIDAEGDNPIVYTGSANYSGNSLYHNDENMLEITECPRLAAMYFAEFLRLFEHYRARDAFEKREAGADQTFKLTPDNTWSKKYFKNNVFANARKAMAGTDG